MTDRISDYRWWRDAVAGNNPATHSSRIECGRFKFKRGNRHLPAAIWVSDDTILYLKLGAGDDALILEGEPDIAPYWENLARYPISEAEYQAGIAGQWINGSNEAPSDFSPEGLNAQVTAAVAIASNITAIANEDSASAAAGSRNRLLELAGIVTKQHAVEKAPVLAAGREIDGRWFAIRDRAKDAADRLRAMLSVYETVKAAKAREANGELQGEKTSRSATYGKAASVRERAVIKSVDDWTLIYQRYMAVPEVIEVLTKLLIRDLIAGETVQGVDFEMVKDVR